MAVFTVFSSGWVKVNDDLFSYLPDSTETRQALDIMEEEFTTFGYANVMVDNVTYSQALKIADMLEGIDGVREVEFDDTTDHFASAAALFTVSFKGETNDDISIETLERVKDSLKGYDTYIHTEVGNPLATIIDKEMIVVDGIAALIVFVVLLITSKTYGEIIVILLTFGGAAILNVGTNFLMGEISFVTDSIAIVLQLALAIDYAVMLCHRYAEAHETLPAKEAAILALTKAIPDIAASSLTTVSGLLALCFMEYELGADLGGVLIKAILLSLCSVFLLMPGLLVTFSKLIDKTHHRNFVPKVSFLGRYAYKTRIIVPAIFVVLLVGAYISSNSVEYVFSQYSIESLRKNEEQLAKQKIEDTFSKHNQMALLIPSGDFDSEKKMIAEIEELDETISVKGLANVEVKDGYYLTDSVGPRTFGEMTGLDYEEARALYSYYAMEQEDYGQAITNIDNYKLPLLDIYLYLCDKQQEIDVGLSQDEKDDLNDMEQELHDADIQLRSENWSRIVIQTDLPLEGDKSYAYLNVLHGIAARYYDDYLIVGDTTSCSELKVSCEGDMLKVNVLTIVFVIAVLIFSFKSAGMPVLLILIIQGSIWINFAIPSLRGERVFFLVYMIISSIQMGANIDYAIVISSRYLELKESMPIRDAMIETLNLAFPTVITSGSMLALSGVAIGAIASNESISSIGVYLGAGTMISIVLVMCVLPQILLLGDLIISKTSFNLDLSREKTQRVGSVKLNGRVKGMVNGYIDAEIHGTFRGEMTASITMGGFEQLPEETVDSANSDDIGESKL